MNDGVTEPGNVTHFYDILRILFPADFFFVCFMEQNVVRISIDKYWGNFRLKHRATDCRILSVQGNAYLFGTVWKSFVNPSRATDSFWNSVWEARSFLKPQQLLVQIMRTKQPSNPVIFSWFNPRSVCLRVEFVSKVLWEEGFIHEERTNPETIALFS